MPSSKSARVFIALVVVSGFALLGHALLHASSDNGIRFISFLLVTCLAARLRVKLPGVSGTMSVNLPFILVAVAEMSAAEALLMGCVSTVFQCLPQAGKKFSWTRCLFSVATIGLAVGATRLLYDSIALQSAIPSRPLLLAVAAAGYFVVNSIPIAIIMGLTEQRNVLRAWGAMLQLSYPYYLASAGVAGVVVAASARVGWQVPLLVLPLMLGMFHSYRCYFSSPAWNHEEMKRAPQSASMAQTAS